jgi:peptidoglycan hydrolase CwlO-like protein
MIEQLLDQLAEIQAQLDVLEMRYNEDCAAVLTDEQHTTLAALNDEYTDAADAAKANAEELTAKIKAAALEAGQGAKGQRLQAVYMAGRVSWDTKALDGYMIHVPELAAFRKEGAPSVQIRGVK